MSHLRCGNLNHDVNHQYFLNFQWKANKLVLCYIFPAPLTLLQNQPPQQMKTRLEPQNSSLTNCHTHHYMYILSTHDNFNEMHFLCLTWFACKFNIKHFPETAIMICTIELSLGSFLNHTAFFDKCKCT